MSGLQLPWYSGKAERVEGNQVLSKKVRKKKGGKPTPGRRRSPSRQRGTSLRLLLSTGGDKWGKWRIYFVKRGKNKLGLARTSSFRTELEKNERISGVGKAT